MLNNFFLAFNRTQKSKTIRTKAPVLLIAALISGSLILTGCGGGSGGAQNADKQNAGEARDQDNADSQGAANGADDNPAPNIPVSELYTKITSLVELDSPVEMPESFLINTYGIDSEILEESLVSLSESATSAETIVILKLKDKGDASKAQDALSVLLQEKSQEMENYLPDQYEIVSKSKIITKDNYVYLVISQYADDIKAIIEENL